MSEQAPKQIYLQSYNSDCYDDNTWCVDQINDEDIEYILQSEYDKLRAENERLREALRSVQALYYNNPSNAYANFFLALSIVDKVLNEVTK